MEYNRLTYISVTPPPHDRTLAQQLSGAFVLFGALVVIGFVVTALAYAVSSTWLTPACERARLVVKADGDAYAAMIDEENGLRGYLMTRDPRFLEAYARGKAALVTANQTLTAYAGSVEELAAPMVGARLGEERWNERWAIAASNTGPDAVPPSMVEGKALFDTYRSDEAVFAAALNERNEALTVREMRVTAARVALDLAVFLLILFLAVRQHRALRDSIVTPVAALLRHIGRVRDGQLEATVDPAGPREIRQLGEGLNEMVRALASARASAEFRDETVRGHSVQLRQILDASREFSESLNLKYVVGAVQSSTTALGGYDRVLVWLMTAEEKRLVSTDEGATEASGVEIGQGLAGRAAKAGRVTFEGPTGLVRFSDSNLTSVRAIAIPLIVGARAVGVLEARYNEARAVTTQAVEVLEMLATHAATAIESARLHELTEERSQMDALTRLFNRRRLDEDLDAECKRSVRYGRPLAFVMLDVDHFKAFNDSHGHPQADTALQEVADVIAGCVRTTDTAYRYGGEEFCILLRETRGEDAMIFAERVRMRIEQRFTSGSAIGITASFGVAEFAASTPTPRALVEAADAAMYESKHAGRNRVMLSSIPPFVAGLPGPGLERDLS
jgi:diguanylate cyclase (GGDEF)-like protein